MEGVNFYLVFKRDEAFWSRSETGLILPPVGTVYLFETYKSKLERPKPSNFKAKVVSITTVLFMDETRPIYEIVLDYEDIPRLLRDKLELFGFEPDFREPPKLVESIA